LTGSAIVLSFVQGGRLNGASLFFYPNNFGEWKVFYNLASTNDLNNGTDT
jgi:hypothetical protein